MVVIKGNTLMAMDKRSAARLKRKLGPATGDPPSAPPGIAWVVKDSATAADLAHWLYEGGTKVTVNGERYPSL